MASLPDQPEAQVLRSLQPKVRSLALELKDVCKQSGFEIRVVRGLRSIDEQNALYAQGRSTPGPIVTQVEGCGSFHNYGVAFDIRPTTSLETEKEMLYDKAGIIGGRIGLEWGGHWQEFVDKPHFQYTAGYSIEDFRTNKVDWKKFEFI
jgi:peptidoglycan L-alanyl-D-glutamate endopeptidase CwlK